MTSNSTGFTLTNLSNLRKDDSIDILGLDPKVSMLLKRENITTVGKFNYFKNKRFTVIKGLNTKDIKAIFTVKRQLRGLQGLKNTGERHLHDSSTRTTTGNYQIPANITQEDPIEALRLPEKLENVLLRSGIQTVGRLNRYTYTNLKKIRFIGESSLKVIRKIRKQLNIKLESDKPTLGNEVSPNALIANQINWDFDLSKIDLFLKQLLGDKIADIIIRRYGLENGEKDTLEEIGKTYNVTRERIRQLQVKGIKILQNVPQATGSKFTGIIDTVLNHNCGLVTDEEIDAIFTEKFQNIAFDGSSIFDIFCDIGLLDYYSIGEIRFYTRVIGLRWGTVKKYTLRQLAEDIIKVLSKNKQTRTVQEIVKELSLLRKSSKYPQEIPVLAEEICKKDPRIEQPVEGKFRVYSHGHASGNMWVGLIKDVLLMENAPLHFTEITERVNDSLYTTDHKLDIRRAHNLLITIPIFAHCGIRGTYGLTDWGFRKESTVDLCKEFIRKAGFAVHFEQIFNYVSKYKNSTKVSIKAILDNSGHFRSIPGGFYMINEKRDDKNER